MNLDMKAISGGCYCRKVRYLCNRVTPEITECHCTQCRKQSGHRYATVGTLADALHIEGEAWITWFKSSPDAERGFCKACGSHLFWRSTENDEMAILAASIDEPTGLKLTSHIFVDNKGDYYQIADDRPQFNGYDKPVSTV